MQSSEKSHRFTNALINEQSPYLLQHAHNPVNWMPWGTQALSIAKQEQKPILLSIGYAACHWCHVMEHESFEDEAVAMFMNTHFVNIKVDREERPDIDQIYMEALQAMTGSGGWPLNIFLFPDGKPFYGGTYFPPKTLQNRASWMDVLQSVIYAFTNRYEELINQANSLTQHLIKTNIQSSAITNVSNEVSIEDFEIIAQRILQNADLQWGGFGGAPKFPQTFALQVLLRAFFHTKDLKYVNHVEFTLQKMIQGGIYDQVQGGFSRYSTDSHWQVPHFEKMLYDNALLMGILAELYQITKNELYIHIVNQTVGFLDTILKDKITGAYYSAMDADSEGEEGKYYVWSYEELSNILLPDQLEKCINYFKVKKEGNWEGKNILWSTSNIQELFDPLLIEIKEKLLLKRNERIAPSIDHKVILSWNALLVIAFAKIFAATGDELYKLKAIDLMHSLEHHLFEVNNHAKHVLTNSILGHDAFLEDYANYIQACIQLHQISGDTNWLHKAKKWMDFTIDHFSDEDHVYFYFTSNTQNDVIIRKKDIYDGAVGSANAIQASNLFLLSHVFEISDWKERSITMLNGIEPMLMKYPSSFGLWAQLYFKVGSGFIDIVGIGERAKNELSRVLSVFNPQILAFFQENADPQIPMLKYKQNIDNQYFICQNNTCSAPEKEISRILAII